MLKNLDIPIREVDGSDAMIRDASGALVLTDGKPAPYTFKILIVRLLQSPDESATADQKADRFGLLMRLYAGGFQDLSHEEMGTITKVVEHPKQDVLVIGRFREWKEEVHTAPNGQPGNRVANVVLDDLPRAKAKR